MTKYLTVSLPENLLKKVDNKREAFAYSSRADFIKQAIRRELERLNKIKTGDAWIFWSLRMLGIFSVKPASRLRRVYLLSNPNFFGWKGENWENRLDSFLKDRWRKMENGNGNNIGNKFTFGIVLRGQLEDINTLIEFLALS